MTSDELIEEWRYSAEVSMAGHYESAQYYQRQHYVIGVPALVFSGLVGSTVFAALGRTEHAPFSLQLATGVASVLAAILTGLQTFLGYNQRAARHKAAGADYAALIRQIHQQSAFPSPNQEELRKFVDKLRVRFDTLSKESPSMPRRIWRRVISESTEKEPD